MDSGVAMISGLWRRILSTFAAALLLLQGMFASARRQLPIGMQASASSHLQVIGATEQAASSKAMAGPDTRARMKPSTMSACSACAVLRPGRQSTAIATTGGAVTSSHSSRPVSSFKISANTAPNTDEQKCDVQRQQQVEDGSSSRKVNKLSSAAQLAGMIQCIDMRRHTLRYTSRRPRCVVAVKIPHAHVDTFQGKAHT